VTDHHPHARRQSGHLIDMPAIGIAARAGNAGSERAGVRAIAITLQGAVAVVLADPGSIIAKWAHHILGDHHALRLCASTYEERQGSMLALHGEPAVQSSGFSAMK
jgi:hypothetical protein